MREREGESFFSHSDGVNMHAWVRQNTGQSRQLKFTGIQYDKILL